jgi:hypothetical protein
MNCIFNELDTILEVIHANFIVRNVRHILISTVDKTLLEVKGTVTCANCLYILVSNYQVNNCINFLLFLSIINCTYIITVCTQK